MKKLNLIIINIILIIFVYAEQFPLKNMELVKVIPRGKGKGELQTSLNPVSPSAFAFDKNGNLYISDKWNNRLVKFNTKFKYIAEYENCYAAYAGRLFITENNELLSISDGVIFAVDDSQGKAKIKIDLRDSNLNKKLDYNPTYIYHDDVFFTYLKDGSLISIFEPGKNNKENINKILDKDNTLKKLLKRERNSNLVIDKNNNNILLNNEIQTRNFNKYLKYQISNKKGKRNSSNLKHKEGFTDEYLLKINNSNIQYIGQDQERNTYWDGGGLRIIILNSLGFVINAFQYDPEKSHISPSVSNNGDIFFIEIIEDKSVNLYKIPRQW